MDKIIDGVDVSECKHFWQEKGLNLCRKNFDNNYFSNGLPCAEKCETHHDCYFKQLKRLQAENEKLKKQYNCYACDSCGGKEDYINMKRHTENAIKTVHKYRQALQEIKDIADRTDGNHPASVINMVSVIRHTINSVMGAEE